MADEQALSFSSPEIPTAENFDQLLRKYGSATFSAEPDSWSMNSDASDSSDASESYKYEVHDSMIQVVLNCFVKKQVDIVCICL